jgi:SOS response regulatory protein OraA/RecX
MVRMGKVSPHVWRELEQQGVSQESIAEAAEEAAKAKLAEITEDVLREVRETSYLGAWMTNS